MPWHSSSGRQMPWHASSGRHLPWHSVSVRYTLRSEGKRTDTPRPEGRCHGRHCPDAVCLDISRPEGQCAADFYLVRICIGGLHLVLHVRWHALSELRIPSWIASWASRRFRRVCSIQMQRLCPDAELCSWCAIPSGCCKCLVIDTQVQNPLSLFNPTIDLAGSISGSTKLPKRLLRLPKVP